MNAIIEKHIINIASGVMIILAILSFVFTLIIAHPFSGIDISTLRTIYMSAAILLFIGGIYTKFIHVPDESENY